jgi:plastocyanin
VLHRLPAALALIAALAACSSSSGPGVESDITVSDNAFAPSALSVDAGTTVTWEWAGDAPHNVTWIGPGAPAASATQTTGTYQRVFDAAGTYDYYCTVHGTPTSGMRGTVTVP